MFSKCHEMSALHVHRYLIGIIIESCRGRGNRHDTLSPARNLDQIKSFKRVFGRRILTNKAHSYRSNCRMTTSNVEIAGQQINSNFHKVQLETAKKVQFLAVPTVHLYILNAVRCPYIRSYVRNAGRGQLSSE